MPKIYITGDCHADFRKFSSRIFHEQKEMTREDFVIVCGDFGGVWADTKDERYWLDWLSEKPFTILFVDGNHENFDRLYNEFEEIDFHGGRAHKIRDNIYHLMRGYIFNICGKKIFAFGGASSHDIDDGILEPSDFEDVNSLIDTYKKLTRRRKMVRINHLSWWKEELPNDEEMKWGLENLEKNSYKVDFIISHCAPQHIASVYSNGHYKPDKLTQYFNKISEKCEFTKWFFGHYHDDENILDKYIMLYNQIIRIA